VTRVFEIVAAAVETSDEMIIDQAASFLLIETLITGLVKACRKKGASQADAVAAIRQGKGKHKLRAALKRSLGTGEYTRRGGKNYADKVIAAGMAAKVSEVRSYVSEVYQACEA
jgi:hypothetical protein